MKFMTSTLALPFLISFGLFVPNLLASDHVLVFVTSMRYDGNLGGIEGANKICQHHAEAAGLPGEYKAWISSSPEQSPVNSFNKSNQSYTLENATLIAKNWDEFVGGLHLAAIDADENGENLGYSTRVWTGTTPQGKDLGKENCNGWSSNSAEDSGWVGVIYKFWTSEWTVEITTSCDEGRNLYCVQQ
jgi:hypothetical protein